MHWQAAAEQQLQSYASEDYPFIPHARLEPLLSVENSIGFQVLVEMTGPLRDRVNDKGNRCTMRQAPLRPVQHAATGWFRISASWLPLQCRRLLPPRWFSPICPVSPR